MKYCPLELSVECTYFPPQPQGGLPSLWGGRHRLDSELWFAVPVIPNQGIAPDETGRDATGQGFKGIVGSPET